MIEKLKEINRLRNSGEITREEADEMKVDLMKGEVEETKETTREIMGACMS